MRLDHLTMASAADLGEAFGVTPRRVLQLAEEGHLPQPVRAGRRAMWPVVVIEEWVARGGSPIREDEAAQDGRSAAGELDDAADVEPTRGDRREASLPEVREPQQAVG